MILQLWKRWGLEERDGAGVHSNGSQSFLASQVVTIVQIITLEDVMRTYAQGKRKYGKSYLQKVRKYSETCIVTTQKKIYHSSHHNLASVPSPYFEQAK